MSNVKTVKATEHEKKEVYEELREWSCVEFFKRIEPSPE